MKKRCLITAMAAVLSLSSAGIAFAGQWIPDAAGWKYQKDDESFYANGWQWIDNKCYYFMPEGYCLLNTTTPDGYTVDASGAWTVNGVVQVQQQELQAGWNQLGNVWKYYTNKKFVTSAWRTIDGKRYYFDESGNMVTGFHDVDGENYYFKPDGSLAATSFTLDGIRYIVGSKGIITDEVDEFEWSSGNYSYNDDYRSNDNGNSGYDNSGYDNSSYDSSDDNGGDVASYARQVFEIVNENRLADGKKELEWDDSLASCAQDRAYEIKEKMSHTRPNETKWHTILGEADITYYSAGENIAAGQGSAKAVMSAWMNSSGHKANILNSSYGRMGVGCAYIDGRYYWVQIFTN